jgi:hypothetical protein
MCNSQYTIKYKSSANSKNHRILTITLKLTYPHCQTLYDDIYQVLKMVTSSRRSSLYQQYYHFIANLILFLKI